MRPVKHFIVASLLFNSHISTSVTLKSTLEYGTKLHFPFGAVSPANNSVILSFSTNLIDCHEFFGTVSVLYCSFGQRHSEMSVSP